MIAAAWSDEQTNKARAMWEAYQQAHDVAPFAGKTAGIDPQSGRVWFGDSAIAIVDELDLLGEFTPLYFVRVGHDYYQRKGTRR